MMPPSNSLKATRPLTPLYLYFSSLYRQALPSLQQENERRQRNERQFQFALLSLYASPPSNVVYTTSPRADIHSLLRSSYLHNRFVVAHSYSSPDGLSWMASVVVPRHLLVSVDSSVFSLPPLPLLPPSTTHPARSYPRMPCEALSAELSTARKEYLERRQLRRERFEGIQADLIAYIMAKYTKKHNVCNWSITSSFPSTSSNQRSGKISAARKRYVERCRKRSESLTGIQDDLKAFMWAYRKETDALFRSCYKHSIYSYSANWFGDMNRALREGTVEDASEKVQGAIHGVVEGFRLGFCGFTSYLKPYKGDCLYRGSGPIPEEPVAGGIFCDKAFFSTSSDKKVACNFVGGKPQDKPRYLFKITKHSTGFNIKKYSRHTREDEILFPPSTWFRVVSVDPAYSWDGIEGTVSLVEMEEMV